MTYAILRTEKCSSLQNVGSRAAHNLRAHQEAAPHADPSKRGQNVVLIGPTTASEVTEAVRAKLDAVPTVRKNAVMAVEVLMTASPEFFAAGGKRTAADWREWEAASMKWLRDTWGDENIVSAVRHMDEGTPHIQVMLVPVDGRGKLNASHWLGGPAKMRALQDSYAEAVEHLDLRRGERKSGANHTSLKSFYALVRRILAAAKDAEKRSKPPTLPERGLLGQVTAKDWAKLEADMKKFGQEGARLRAEAMAGAILVKSGLGGEAASRLQKMEQMTQKAEAHLQRLSDSIKGAQSDLDALRNEFVTLDGMVAAKRQEARELGLQAPESPTPGEVPKPRPR